MSNKVESLRDLFLGIFIGIVVATAAFVYGLIWFFGAPL